MAKDWRKKSVLA